MAVAQPVCVGHMTSVVWRVKSHDHMCSISKRGGSCLECGLCQATEEGVVWSVA